MKALIITLTAWQLVHAPGCEEKKETKGFYRSYDKCMEQVVNLEDKTTGTYYCREIVFENTAHD